MSSDVQITGGADPEVAAAIAAVVDAVIRAETARDTGAPREIGRSAWVRAAHLRDRPELRARSKNDEEAPGPPAAPS